VTPAHPFSVCVHVSPTSSPSHGLPDTRQLGAQVAFSWKR
jgi:hypothetical protein